MEGERKKQTQCDGKAVKYIIYLHWQRETNAFTMIEDTSPSHIDTRTYRRTHFVLENTLCKTEGRGKTHFPKAGGKRREKSDARKEEIRGCGE